MLNRLKFYSLLLLGWYPIIRSSYGERIIGARIPLNEILGSESGDSSVDMFHMNIIEELSTDNTRSSSIKKHIAFTAELWC